MLVGAGVGYGTPYDAANVTDDRAAAWRPYLWSADAQLNMYRDRIAARARDLVRNDGWASGAVTRLLDNAIGASFRPISKPDHRALAAYTGNPAFDASWAEDFGRAVDAHYRSWADDDLGRYCDLERNMWLGELFGVAFRHLLIDNDALAVLQDRPERVYPGGARYDLCVNLIDPDRLSNPQNVFDRRYLRGGVKIDDDGVTVGYHIRKAHQGDWWAAVDAVTWEYIPR
jgi:capsid protein